MRKQHLLPISYGGGGIESGSGKTEKVIGFPDREESEGEEERKLERKEQQLGQGNEMEDSQRRVSKAKRKSEEGRRGKTVEKRVKDIVRAEERGSTGRATKRD